MANLISDTIEEDTADLQFPKDWTSSDKHYEKLEMPVEREGNFTSDLTCFICKCFLSEPYIHCAMCDCVMLCALCFSKGQEQDNHRNYHDYMIVKNDFSLIEDSGWSAKEEMILLALIQDCGFGNWIDVSRRLPGKSSEDCKRHYLQHYIDNQSLIGLPKIEETLSSHFGLKSISYNFNLEGVEDPPRFIPRTLNHKLLAGYSAARSDFDINFDNHAELLISNLNFKEFSSNDSYFELNQELQLALVNAYNARLKERAKRKKIIKDHGLISSRKTMSCLKRYDTTITKSLAGRLRAFTQLVDGIQFDSIMECLHQIGNLKNYLRQLFTYRKMGFNISTVYQCLKNFGNSNKKMKRKKQYIIGLDYNWKSTNQIALNENISNPINISRRKTAPPLELHSGMIGYEKLSGTEKELCSIIRVLPDAYIDIKLLLVNENKKYGFVKLAQARQLLKIDVNKTKKIHDFLAQEGYININ